MSATQYAIAQQYREAGARVESQFIDSIGASYTAALDRLDTQIDALAKRIASADDPTIGQLLQMEQYKALAEQIQTEYAAIATGDTFPKVESLAGIGIDIGDRMANDELGAAGFANVAALGNEESARLLDAIINGGDLGKATSAIPGGAKQKVQQAMMVGLLLGDNPLTVASRMKADLADRTLSDIRTLTRTTMMGSQREAALANYNRNKDGLDGWVWMAALANSPGPCLACLAQHGTVHPLKESMTSHPNCRCTMAPKVKESLVTIQTGEEWFESLTPDQQRGIMGPGRFDAWQQGQFSFKQMASYAKGKYGVGMGVTPLHMLKQGKNLGGAATKQWDVRIAAGGDVFNQYAAPTHDELAAATADQKEYYNSFDRQALADRQALEDYRGAYYQPLNKHLRHPDTAGLSPELLEIADSLTIKLDTAFSASVATIPNDIKVYRGGRAPSDAKPGDIVIDKGYVSTSIDEQISVGFKSFTDENAIWEINIPAGASGIYLDSALSPYQSEVLLNRNTKMRIIDRQGNRIIAEVVIDD